MWYIANISQQYELWICEKPGIGPKNAISTGNDDNLAILRQFIYGQDICLIHFIYNQRHHVFSGFGFKRHYLACQQQTYWTAEPTHMRFVYCPTDGITTDQKMINARIIEGCLTLVTNCAPFSWNFWDSMEFWLIVFWAECFAHDIPDVTAVLLKTAEGPGNIWQNIFVGRLGALFCSVFNVVYFPPRSILPHHDCLHDHRRVHHNHHRHVYSYLDHQKHWVLNHPLHPSCWSSQEKQWCDQQVRKKVGLSNDKAR